MYDGADDLFCILCIQADRDRIDSAEFFEKYGLSFHDRHSCVCTNVAKSENRTSIGDNGDGICLHRIFVSGLLILCNDLARLCNAGRICDSQVLPGFYVRLCSSLDFSVPEFVHFQRFF